MPQITNHIIKQIYQELDKTYFTSASFLVSFPDRSDVLFDCKFIEHPSFLFQLIKSSSSVLSKVYTVKYCPGAIMTTEQLVTDSFDDCLKAMLAWTNYLKS